MIWTIACEDCGVHRRTSYKNTKVCMSCRLLRDLAFIENDERTCRSNGCKNTFAPVKRKDLFCGDCASIMAAEHGYCKFCKKDDVGLYHGLAICEKCVRDVGMRPKVIQGLRVGQRDRKTKDYGTLPVQPKPRPAAAPTKPIPAPSI